MIDILTSHTSVREYTDEQISDERFQHMLWTAQHVASSNFVQAYSVIQVKDEQLKKELGRLSKNEKQFETAALSLLFCADLNRVTYAVKKQGEHIESGTLENFVVAMIDTALLAQNFVVVAESSGYGICYIGGVRNNPKQISDLFSLPDNVMPLFGMTVGVPKEKDEVKPRLPTESILHINGYDESKYEKQIELYDKLIENYYSNRKRNPKKVTWSKTMVDFLSEKRRPFLKEFVLSKGFLKDE